MTIKKKCPSCSSSFSCGDMKSASAVCWCNNYPPIVALDFSQDCLCPKCLHQKILEKTINYVKEIAEKGIEHNTAANLKSSTEFIPDIDYYIENGFWVFTAWHHLKRGNCCKSGCRHCPYGFKK